jgi:haloalkane dehalogenase
MTAPISYDSARPELVEAGDARIAVRRYGEGPDVLLVHGFPLHGYTWRYLLPDLARQFRCWVVDLPGLGESVWGQDTDFRFGAQADRLGGVLDKLGVTRTAIVAQDTGATIARLLALARPELVSHLALINTEIPGHRPPWIREFQLSTWLPGARLSFRLLLSWRAFRRSSAGFGGLFTDPSRLDGEFYDRFVQPLLVDPQRLAGTLHYLRGIDWKAVDSLAQRHREIKAAVIALWGADDPTFPVNLAEQMCSQFTPPCTLHRIAGARLLPHEERPDELLAHLVPFLKTGSPPSRG